MLPEPMVTIARAANPELTAALDLTAEWDKVSEAGSLVQGCVVVRKAFADEHPNEVKAFLDEYKASIEFLTAEPEQAGQMIQDAGIFAKAAVAPRPSRTATSALSPARRCRRRSRRFSPR